MIWSMARAFISAANKASHLGTRLGRTTLCPSNEEYLQREPAENGGNTIGVV